MLLLVLVRWNIFNAALCASAGVHCCTAVPNKIASLGDLDRAIARVRTKTRTMQPHLFRQFCHCRLQRKKGQVSIE
jgi:hypothetical protein